MTRLIRFLAIFMAGIFLSSAFADDAFARRKRRKKAAQKEAAANAEAEAKAAEEAANADGRRIAVLSLRALGLPSDLRRNLELFLRNSISTIEGINVVSPVDIEIALRDPANKEAAECGGGHACAAKVGALVGADTVVFGNVGAMGDTFILNIRAVDVASAKEVGRQSASISGNRDLLIPEMRLAAYKLVAPESIFGSLLIQIDVEGVEVEIDGNIVGTTPIKEPIGRLKPGPHVVVLKRPGYSTFQKEFEIKPFETARLKLDLKSTTPEQPEPVKP